MSKRRLGLDIYGPLACGHVILSDNIVQSYGSNSITADFVSYFKVMEINPDEQIQIDDGTR